MTTQPYPNFFALRHDRSEVVPCHNLSSARAIAAGRAPSLDTNTNGSFTYKAVPFVSPTGQYYVEILAGSYRIRLDVANVQTARHYARNGVPTEIANEAWLQEIGLKLFKNNQ